jgi:hypothetical protein
MALAAPCEHTAVSKTRNQLDENTTTMWLKPSSLHLQPDYLISPQPSQFWGHMGLTEPARGTYTRFMPSLP